MMSLLAIVLMFYIKIYFAHILFLHFISFRQITALTLLLYSGLNQVTLRYNFFSLTVRVNW